MKTIQQLAIESEQIQNASNLCGFAQRFAQVLIELGEHTNGTEQRNTHPIVTLWLDKLNSLNKYTGSMDELNSAMIKIEELKNVKNQS